MEPKDEFRPHLGGPLFLSAVLLSKPSYFPTAPQLLPLLELGREAHC